MLTEKVYAFSFKFHHITISDRVTSFTIVNIKRNFTALRVFKCQLYVQVSIY